MLKFKKPMRINNLYCTPLFLLSSTQFHSSAVLLSDDAEIKKVEEKLAQIKETPTTYQNFGVESPISDNTEIAPDANNLNQPIIEDLKNDLPTDFVDTVTKISNDAASLDPLVPYDDETFYDKFPLLKDDDSLEAKEKKNH